jgi:glutamine synthetase
MNVRAAIVRTITQKVRSKNESFVPHSLQFGARVFSYPLLKDLISPKAFQNFSHVQAGKEALQLSTANEIAQALKSWALQKGATHFTHWFQPLTGIAAEKHDAFLALKEKGQVVESFSGKDLLSGEPDASSFPSGGLRATYQARGYTSWDPLSPPFLWEGGGGLTLCIPSLFFSWTGAPLDYKIPLLRSDQKIDHAVSRLLKFADVAASKVFSTVGIEQEYFLIDRQLFLLRPDLLLAGRTVYGARPPKGQELEDHYFGTIKERVFSFMQDFEAQAIQLGIPLKTRHNEVAPAQHEVAPIFEPASQAVDHNVLLMELMRQTAMKHDLSCLFHEKPFARINGSGKHNNWSLATDTGLNLLNPKGNRFVFLTLVTAIVRAVHDHASLLRASIGSAGNDHRLGGSEAPPTILSVYLGTHLEQLVSDVIHMRKSDSIQARKIDLGLSHMALHDADESDRNRTSFFAFTGNKFEFRAVGASAHCGLPMTVLNSIVADTLELIMDELEEHVQEKNLSEDALLQKTLPFLQKHLKLAEPVLFGGNGYTAEWEREAEQRGLPNIRKSFHAFSMLLDPKTIRVFDGILTEEELHARYEVLVEQYVKTVNIEANLMVDLFRTQILPAALFDQKNRATSLRSLGDLKLDPPADLLASLQTFSTLISHANLAIDEIVKIQHQSSDFGWEAKGKVYTELLTVKMSHARALVDHLEELLDNTLWPLPKYRELLFII